MAHAKKGFARKDRVSEQIRRELAEIIRRDLKDPRVGMISLTDVEITADYAHAKVFFSTLNEDKLSDIEKGLSQAALFLRRALGKSLHLHTLPALHFVFDNSLSYGAHITTVIDEALLRTSLENVDNLENTENTEPIKTAENTDFSLPKE